MSARARTPAWRPSTMREAWGLLGVLLLALLVLTGSGCGSGRSAGAHEVDLVWQKLRKNLRYISAGHQLGSTFYWFGGGTCWFSDIGLEEPFVNNGTSGVDLRSPDGRVYIHVDTSYSMEIHGATPLDVCVEQVRKALNW